MISRLFLLLSFLFLSPWAMAKLSDKLAPDIRLTYEIVFEQNDFLVLKSRSLNAEIITVREWQNEAFKNNEPNETEPDWDKELFADRYELLEVFGLQKQQLVTVFTRDDRKTALIHSTWLAHEQYELETSVFDKDKIISIVWSTQTENGARSSLEKLQNFAEQYSGDRSPAAAKSSKTEADYCLLCDVNLYEEPVRETLASIEKTIRPTCKRDPPGGVTAAQAGKWILGCVKGLAGSVLSIIKMFYEIANFTVKMTFNSRYQQKVADSVGSATSAFIWHPIDTMTSMYKVVEGLVLKESVTLATCGREYRAKATCQLFGELISGGLIVKSIKRILGVADKTSGLHRIAGAKYNHPIRKQVARTTARRLAGATPTRALIATAIIDQENPHLKVKPKLTPPKERSELARTNRTRSTDRAPQKSPIPAAARDRIIEKSLQYNPTTVTQNSRFINKALISRISDNRIFLDVENSLMKKINDLTKDKNLVTALTNLHKKILISEIDELLKRNPGLKLSTYSDFKAMRFAFEGRLPDDLAKQLEKTVRQAGEKFKAETPEFDNLIPGMNPAEWFKAGIGQTADRANLAARAARQSEGTGFSDIRDFSHPQVRDRMNVRVKEVELIRSDLEKSPSLRKLMEGPTGAQIPTQEVFDLIRKNPDAKKLAEVLRKRFNSREYTEADAQRLLSYSDRVDEFSPGLNIAEREIVNLDEAVNGGLSGDFLGMGSSNQTATAHALARANTIDDAIIGTRLGEQSVTTLFSRRLERFREIIGDIAKCSGDDCVAVATKPMTRKNKEALMNRLSRDPLTREIRLSFVAKGITRAADRTLISTHGESIEKLLRKSLEGKIPRERLRLMTFGIDMQTTVANTGRVEVLSAIEGKAVSAADNESIQTALVKAVREHNRLMKTENQIRSSYSTP